MNLLVNSITIVDLSNKEARKINFSSGKNLLTSAKNHLGKSIIMKSIYYTLGAEVYFPTPIKNINLLTFIDFTISNSSFLLARLNRSFVMYKNNRFYKKYSSVGQVGEDLSKLFNLEINLVGKDDAGTIISCPPAFYFLPYYVDQENGWSNHSYSFDKLSQFDLPQRKNSYLFHLGVLDNNFVEISKEQKSNERRVSTLEKENDRLKMVVDTLSSGLDSTQMAFDVEALEATIDKRKDELQGLLKKVGKSRQDLILAEDEKSTLTHDKEILAKYIKQKHSKTHIAEDREAVECPKCGMIFERAITDRLEKTYLLESLNDDYVTTTQNIVQLESRIERLKRIFSESQWNLKIFEKSLASQQDLYDTYLKAKTTRKLLDGYEQQIGTNITEINALAQKNSDIRKQLGNYLERRTNANSIYNEHLTQLFTSLDIPQSQVEESSGLGASLTASGAYGPRCKIAQMLAFVQAKQIMCPEIVDFPLVIDSPNTLEQDDEHLDSVLRTLFTWDKTSNQIIVASITGKGIAESIPDVHIIELTNPETHLLSTDEYENNEIEIENIFMQF